MKFSNGCWVMQESIECFSPQEAYFVTTTDTEVSINAPTTRIRHRGDTLGGVNLTIKITSPMKDVLRVQTYHHMGAKQQGPAFELEQTNTLPLDITENDDLLLIKSGNLELEINKKDWNMTYKRNGSFLTKSGSRDLALMKKNLTLSPDTRLHLSSKNQNNYQKHKRLCNKVFFRHLTLRFPAQK